MEHHELTTVETARDLGLLPEEFDRIREILGRVPNFTELSIFSVMWSEHCSYKNSITWLKTLPKDGPRMLAKAGEENAGLVDLGGGIGCAFKIESHNHPSALEPYQGAATGVGGINRDIFTMGARPIAQLNSLRFGDLSLDRTKWLVKGVVKGISHYGNAFGIPTVGGELFFDDCYNVNPLVNAFSAGIVKAGETVSATSYGVGNPVYIVGSATGKDGIHGAAFRVEGYYRRFGERSACGTGRRPVPGKTAAGSYFGSDQNRRCSGHAGYGRGGDHLLQFGNVGQGRTWHEDIFRQSADAPGKYEAV